MMNPEKKEIHKYALPKVESVDYLLIITSRVQKVTMRNGLIDIFLFHHTINMVHTLMVNQSPPLKIR